MSHKIIFVVVSEFRTFLKVKNIYIFYCVQESTHNDLIALQKKYIENKVFIYL